eukprot:485791-Rhodomonas_salina.3
MSVSVDVGPGSWPGEGFDDETLLKFVSRCPLFPPVYFHANGPSDLWTPVLSCYFFLVFPRVFPRGFDDCGMRSARYVTSVNIACGGHVGDEASMARTVELV